jgi:hypothetical protein
VCCTDIFLLCDKCEYGQHTTCLTPPLEEVPEGKWFCPECLQADLLATLKTRVMVRVCEGERDREKRERGEVVLSRVPPGRSASHLEDLSHGGGERKRERERERMEERRTGRETVFAIVSLH